MQTDHILVAIDSSGLATEVVQAAGTLAAALSARVTLLTVVTLPVGVNPFGMTDGRRNDEILAEDASNDLEPYVALLERDGVEVTKVLAHGDVPIAILQAVDEHQPGMVVIGTRGRIGIAKLISGSVAEAVLRVSPVPVLVVRSAAVGLDPTE
ncbi:MAG: universal stress protein [Myxococcota bacterium]